MTGNSKRSRDAIRARVLRTVRTVARMKRSEIRERRSSLNAAPRITLRFIRATTTKEKRKRNADRRVQPTSAPYGRGARPCLFPLSRLRGRVRGGGTLAYRRSTTALTVRAFGPWAQLQARLPGTRQDVRSCTVAPTGEQRPRALTRALPAPACPSPGNAPPGPVVVPVSMMPEAARVRSVSFRARAPHSLRIREYPRPKACSGVPREHDPLR